MKKQQNKITEMVFVLDASGSMHGLEKDTVGGVNSILQEQKNLQNGDTVYVSTVFFNHASRVIHDRAELSKIALMTERDYTVGGSTALYDALGNAMKHISNIHKYARAEDVPEKTMFVVMTDGMENASRQYTQEQVKKMIQDKQDGGWEFLFLAANIDAGSAALDIGIAAERAVDWHADGTGVQTVYECVNECVKNTRARKAYSRRVFAEADQDFQTRKGDNR